MTYKLKLDVFEGPLDLLLYLIKKNDLDICDIPIAEVTDQYMEYIEMMKMLDLEVVGEFLVMAATLMQIKSKMLLPPDPSEEPEEEEDPRDELMRRLQEYRIFKEVAEQLKEREIQQKDFYPRRVDSEQRKELQDEAKEVYFEANLFDLINAFTKALRKFKEKAVYEITEEEFTVEQKIHDILHLLLKVNKVFLNDLFDKARSKPEVIVIFMAILELIRLREIKVMQKRLFSDIEIMRNRENVIPTEAPEAEQDAGQEDPEPSPALEQALADEETPDEGEAEEPVQGNEI